MTVILFILTGSHIYFNILTDLEVLAIFFVFNLSFSDESETYTFEIICSLIVFSLITILIVSQFILKKKYFLGQNARRLVGILDRKAITDKYYDIKIRSYHQRNEQYKQIII